MKLNKFLFQEYNVSKIDIYKDKFIIIWRILENGNLKEVRWLFKTYPKQEIVNFIKTSGLRKLSIKSLCFWLNYFNIKGKEKIIREKIKNPLWKF